MNKNFRTVLLYLVLLAVLVWVVIVQLNKTTDGRPDELPTSEFVTAVKDGRVARGHLRGRATASSTGKYWETDEGQDRQGDAQGVHLDLRRARTRSPS